MVEWYGMLKWYLLVAWPRYFNYFNGDRVIMITWFGFNFHLCCACHVLYAE